MDRRTFAIASLSACSVPSIGNITGPKEKPSKEGLEEFQFGETKALQLKSSPVKWQGGDIHLLSLNQFLFSLDSNSNRLSARVKGSLLTFDNVDYTIGAAVLGSDGSMLGTSSVVCHVPRIWLGIFAQQPVELTLDFGVSNNYSLASKFQVSISDRTVLTPDQWQKR